MLVAYINTLEELEFWKIVTENIQNFSLTFFDLLAFVEKILWLSMTLPDLPKFQYISPWLLDCMNPAIFSLYRILSVWIKSTKSMKMLLCLSALRTVHQPPSPNFNKVLCRNFLINAGFYRSLKYLIQVNQ